MGAILNRIKYEKPLLNGQRYNALSGGEKIWNDTYSYINCTAFGCLKLSITDYAAGDGIEIKLNIAEKQQAYGVLPVYISDGANANYAGILPIMDGASNLMRVDRFGSGTQYVYFPVNPTQMQINTDYPLKTVFNGNNVELIVNGSSQGTKTLGAMTAISDRTLWLFGKNNTYCFKGRIYYAKIISSGGIVKHSFIPYNNGGTATMKDIVTGNICDVASGAFELIE
jgi:hypothetical protein